MSFLGKLLGVISGNSGLKVSEQLLFDKVIGFRGVVPGVGTSTIVQNTAIALASRTNFSICVLDTNFMYPTLYPMLKKEEKSKDRDYLDFTDDLAQVVEFTDYRNVHLFSLRDRGIIDMLTSQDSEILIDRLIGRLKSFFDIILIDLSYEPTNVSTFAAIKCNKVINIADMSLKSLYHFRKSLNTMATLAVPFAKADKVVVNKVLPDVLTDPKGAFEEAGLTVLGEIPFSLEIAKAGVTGKRLWSPSTSSRDIFAFSGVIDSVIDSILSITPLNEKYINETPLEDISSETVKNSEAVEEEQREISEEVKISQEVPANDTSEEGNVSKESNDEAEVSAPGKESTSTDIRKGKSDSLNTLPEVEESQLEEATPPVEEPLKEKVEVLEEVIVFKPKK